MKLAEQLEEFWEREMKVTETTDGLARQVVHKLQAQNKLMYEELVVWSKFGSGLPWEPEVVANTKKVLAQIAEIEGK